MLKLSFTAGSVMPVTLPSISLPPTVKALIRLVAACSACRRLLTPKPSGRTALPPVARKQHAACFQEPGRQFFSGAGSVYQPVHPKSKRSFTFIPLFLLSLLHRGIANQTPTTRRTDRSSCTQCVLRITATTTFFYEKKSTHVQYGAGPYAACAQPSGPTG